MITHKMTQDIVIVCLSFNLLWKGVLEHIRIVNLGAGLLLFVEEAETISGGNAL
jgi:hypothetical protein